MAQIYENNAGEIMQKCLQALQKQTSVLSNELQMKKNSPKTKDQMKQLFASNINSSLSPLEESENNKIIEKLRKKNNKKKQLKDVVIRKTDLGQNQHIFTKQELQKLKEIDQDELYGMNFLKPLPKITEAPTPLQKSDELPSVSDQSNRKYFVSPSNLDNPHDQILKYLNWVDTNQLKVNKDKKKSKILNFQKRQRSSSNSLESFNKKLKNPLPVLMPKMSSPFRGFKGPELGKAKSCYPIMKKNSLDVDKRFLRSINANETQDKRVGQKQKMNEIIFRANQYIEKEFSSSYTDNKYIYMTDERKQALFECEVLRRIKREIGPKFYQRLQLNYGNKPNRPKTNEDDIEYEKQNDERNLNGLGEGANFKKNQTRNFVQNGKQKNYAGQKQKLTFESQAERMIHKNRNRLKEERKRVIERIVC